MESESSHANESPSVQLKIGSIFAEKYEILEYIASGASGQVFKTKDLHRQVIVALKILPLGTDAKQIMRFQQEAKLASKLKHPNIATIFDFNFQDNVAYIAMEYIDGQRLDAVFRTSSPFELEKFCDIFIQVGKAVSHAHKNGIVHRDLKPGNILVCEKADGTSIVKILDFGIAKFFDPKSVEENKLTGTGLIIGTPLYMSPEQARALPVTPLADVYSIGSVMFSCVAGHAPLEGSNVMETIMLIANTPAPLLEASYDGESLPEALTALIARMLSKAPEERPSIDTEVVPTLLKLTDSHSEVQDEDHTGDTTHDASSKKDNRTVVAAIVALIILIVAVPIWLVQQQPTPSEHPSSSATKTTTAETLKSPIANYAQAPVSDEFFRTITNPTIAVSLDASQSDLKTMEFLKRFSNLKSLTVQETAINDDSVANIVDLPLTNLDLGNNAGISDDAIPYICKIKTLQDLDLSTTKITGKNLHLLSSLSALHRLNIAGNTIAESDLETLAKGLKPDCQLLIDSESDEKNAIKRRLKDKFPQLSFTDGKSNIIDRFAKINEKFDDKPHPQKYWSDIQDEYQELVDELENANTKNLTLCELYGALGNTALKIKGRESAKKALLSFSKAYKLALECGETNYALSLLDSNFAVISMLDDSNSKKLGDELLTLGRKHNFPNDIILERYLYLSKTDDKPTKEDFLLSAEYFEKAAQVVKEDNPNSPAIPSYYCYMGDRYCSAGDIKSGLACYLKSIELFKRNKPTTKEERFAHVMAWEHCANIYDLQKQYEKSLEFGTRCYEMGKKQNIDNYFLRVMLGRCTKASIELKRPSSELEKLEKEEKLLNARESK